MVLRSFSCVLPLRIRERSSELSDDLVAHEALESLKETELSVATLIEQDALSIIEDEPSTFL